MFLTTLLTEEIEVSPHGEGDKANKSVLEKIYPTQNGELFNAFLGSPQRQSAPIHESRLRLGYLLKARRSAGRWWSSDNADWKSVVVTWSGRRLYPLHCMKRPFVRPPPTPV